MEQEKLMRPSYEEIGLSALQLKKGWQWRQSPPYERISQVTGAKSGTGSRVGEEAGAV